MPIEKAVSTAIEECIDNNVLREFLEKERAVVMSLSVFEFNKEREFKIVREDEREEGIRIGMERGLQQGIIAYIKQAIKYGVSHEEAICVAADEFNVTEEYIRNIIAEADIIC